eukprot:403361673
MGGQPSFPRAEQLDPVKIGICEIHNNLLIYYCQQTPKCEAKNPYFCKECGEEEGKHSHELKRRDDYCIKMYLHFQWLFEKMERIHDEAVRKYKQQEIIISWANEQLKQTQNLHYGHSKDILRDDYQEILSTMRKVEVTRDRIKLNFIDYKVVEIEEDMKMIPQVKKFLIRVDYFQILDDDFVFKKYKEVFKLRNPCISPAEMKNLEFINRHTKFQIYALFEEFDQLKENMAKEKQKLLIDQVGKNWFIITICFFEIIFQQSFTRAIMLYFNCILFSSIFTIMLNNN